MSAPSIVLELMRHPSGEYRRPCPQCEKGKRDDALAIRVDERGATWYCHRCQFTGALDRSERYRTTVHTPPRPIKQDIPLRWSEGAQAIWDRAKPVRGSIVETYLRGRGCALPPPEGDLRFLPAREEFPPCMVAKLTDFATGAGMSLHFTRLKPDGSGKADTERDKNLLKGHQKRGGVIRLWPDDAVGYSLALAEGIESALCAARLHSPAWSTIDAGNMGELPVLRGIETLVVYADHDEAGIKAARRLVLRWRAAGKQATALMPKAPGEDAADVLARRGVA